MTKVKTNRPKMRTPATSKYSGWSVSTLNKMRVSGRGPAYYKIGRVVVYDPDDVDEWLANNRRLSTSVAAS